MQLKHLIPIDKYTVELHESLDQGPNDESQILARDYEHKSQEFVQKKAQLEQILAKPAQDWEKLAEPIIGDNLYLGMAWRIAKLTTSLKGIKDTLPAKQGDDLARSQNDLRETDKELKELEAELKKKLDEDKRKLTAL